MLKMSDTPIRDFLPFFASLGIRVAFLVPTPTGYYKSIMDATMPLREMLRETGIHDYTQQEQGQENKIAEELLEKNQITHNRGFLPSVTEGDPGVGDTLENALGISRNPSKLPDYKGIELKASRTSTYKKPKTRNRVNLFPQLLDEGIITVDYIMHRKDNGTVRDHGFPFKIFPDDLDMLFPEPKTYDLQMEDS